ncbi:MAG: transglycosylase SLT domain-containing protein [Terriglobia bacterium]
MLAAFASFAYSADQPALRLGQGVNAYNVHDFGAAAQALRGLESQLPWLSDYVMYYRASSELSLGDAASAARDLAVYRANPIASSPLAGKIVWLGARALLDMKQPASNGKALELLQTNYKDLSQPEGDFALGLAFEALGEKLQAALAYEKVYYGFPNTPAAALSAPAIERLRAALGKDFPTAPSRQQLERCQKWLDVKEFSKAREEYTALAETLPEPERMDARVGIGVADFLSGDSTAALRYLKALKIPRSEANARRLYYLTEAARRGADDIAMMDAVRQLNERYSESPWRLKALITAGNRWVVGNDRDKYEPLFRAASDAFPSDSATAFCHWKITWDSYIGDKADRSDLLREQILRYPTDSRAGTALYYLGRLAEKDGKYGEARSYYDRLSAQFPHYYYGMLARERIAQSKASSAVPDEAATTWLSTVDWPQHRDFSAVEPNTATRARIDRARLLMMAGLPDLADTELRFGAKLETEQPALLAMELARSMPSPFQALRIMKSFIGDYLSIPFDNAPLKFWEMLFPLPYKDEVVKSAKVHDLDPYSVAALIRQETEFNPSAHSGANAYGLMQLIPSTGRMVGRQAGIPVSGTRSLLDPSTNIQLGTQYLRGQLNNWDGNWVQTLAAYNAGPGRVRQWLTWATFREPAEFVETIPFNETKEYVQAVLRNAEMYRLVYGQKHVAAAVLKDVSDVPPVNLSSLPVAARTPGGGRVAVKATKKTPGRKRVTATSRAATSKKSVAARRTAAQKKKTPS